MSMSEFDINKELEVINIKDNLQKIDIIYPNSTKYDFQYFYHGHRLGTRVPLFVILSAEADWQEESIYYFCKIGNVFSMKMSLQLSGSDLIGVLFSNILRRYGSNYGILINYAASSVKFNILNTITNSPFLESEIDCIVQIADNSNTENLHGILMVSVPKVTDLDLQNALILERVQRELKINCLDWTWQYEQSDKLFLFSKLVFKNLEKWKNTESIGGAVEGTRIIPMKLMRDDDEEHSPQHVLDLFPDLGLIIDLSNDEGSYEKSRFTEKQIEYQRIQIESKAIPSSTDVFLFVSLVKDFKERKPNKDIIVHCHYGYNRTGLMICAYLIEEGHVTVREALRRFRISRPPGIKHQNYIDKLVLRYSDYKTTN